MGQPSSACAPHPHLDERFAEDAERVTDAGNLEQDGVDDPVVVAALERLGEVIQNLLGDVGELRLERRVVTSTHQHTQNNSQSMSWV